MHKYTIKLYQHYITPKFSFLKSSSSGNATKTVQRKSSNKCHQI